MLGIQPVPSLNCDVGKEVLSSLTDYGENKSLQNEITGVRLSGSKSAKPDSELWFLLFQVQWPCPSTAYPSEGSWLMSVPVLVA